MDKPFGKTPGPFSALKPLILASASPRRKAILERLGLEFDLRPFDVDETIHPGDTPETAAERLARRKAAAAAEVVTKGTIIGCDTLVAVKDTILGKPEDEGDAKRMLTFLSGKTQRVISGLALIHRSTGIELSGYASTTLYTRAMSSADIEAYVATGECFGKAGAYAIQETGDRFIERLEGSYDNVVGFPTELFLDSMAELERKIAHDRL